MTNFYNILHIFSLTFNGLNRESSAFGLHELDHMTFCATLVEAWNGYSTYSVLAILLFSLYFFTLMVNTHIWYISENKVSFGNFVTNSCFIFNKKSH